MDLEEPTSFLDHVCLGCTQRECKPNEDIVNQCREMFESRMFESRISATATEKYQSERKFTQKLSRGLTAWTDMRTNCVEWYCGRANKKTEQLYTVSTLRLDDHNFKKEELESVGELSDVCSQIVLKCLYMYLARTGRLDILWSVNKLARSVTKWTRACDRRV